MPAVIIDLNPANLQEAEDLLDGLDPMIEVELLELYQEGGELIIERASELAPKKTGLMASLIGYVVIYRGITIVGGADYTSFQEYGTQFILAKFFITTAIEEIMPQIDAEAEALVAEYIQMQVAEINAVPFEVTEFLVF